MPVATVGRFCLYILYVEASLDYVIMVVKRLTQYKMYLSIFRILAHVVITATIGLAVIR